jgi:ankyrin repeat protein
MVMDTQLASLLLATARAGDAALLRLLVPPAGNLEEDGPPDAPGGVTPLMAAAASGHEEVVEVLLACGADAGKRDAKGRRAAAHARDGGHPCLAKRLDTVVDKDETIW